jgi:hypothetical protein
MTFVYEQVKRRMYCPCSVSAIWSVLGFVLNIVLYKFFNIDKSTALFNGGIFLLFSLYFSSAWLLYNNSSIGEYITNIFALSIPVGLFAVAYFLNTFTISNYVIIYLAIIVVLYIFLIKVNNLEINKLEIIYAIILFSSIYPIYLLDVDVIIKAGLLMYISVEIIKSINRMTYDINQEILYEVMNLFVLSVYLLLLGSFFNTVLITYNL